MLNVLFKFIITIHLICVHGYPLFRHIKAKRVLLFDSCLGKSLLFLIIRMYIYKYMKPSYSLILSGV